MMVWEVRHKPNFNVIPIAAPIIRGVHLLREFRGTHARNNERFAKWPLTYGFRPAAQ
jgi:hypothetical protein